jgi:anhydro-N-acetylmuramic acid kinase
MKQRSIIGLMSGTSLDGLDIALCRFSGVSFDTKCEVIAFETVPIPEPLRSRLQKVIHDRNAQLLEITLLNAEFGRFCGDAVLDFLTIRELAPSSIDLVVSHGQTLFHAPGNTDWRGDTLNATFQIGDGDHVAGRCGIPVLTDLRQKHTASGRQGAPLAVYLDVLLLGRRGKTRALLNLGGISNITIIDFPGDSPKLFSTDCGPANTLVDGFTSRHCNQPFDRNGDIAASGRSNDELLNALLGHPFFDLPYPKSTGREVFHPEWLETVLAGFPELTNQDILATLTEFTAFSVARAIRSSLCNPGEMLVSGGGVHNKTLMTMLQNALPDWTVNPLTEINPDAKEAVLFALLGNEYLENTNGSYPWGPAALGKLCLP